MDLTYLKKRAEMTQDFYDGKVQTALQKIAPEPITLDDADADIGNGYECVVPNKLFRNWIDLIPESDRSFVRFIYQDGAAASLEKYIKAAMTAIAWKNLKAAVSEAQSESDLFLMRLIIWHCLVLKAPLGVDFGNYEMNQIFNALPIDVAHDRIKVERPSFADFYKQIKYAQMAVRDGD